MRGEEEQGLARADRYDANLNALISQELHARQEIGDKIRNQQEILS